MHTQSKFRLLVVRLGAMGDILHALPAVTALRQAHPGWIIDWVVEPRWQALLTAAPESEAASCKAGDPRQPLVDTIHFASTKSWRNKPLSGGTIGEISTLRRSLKQGHYDAVLDLQGAIRSAVIGRMAGCRRCIGEARPREQAAAWFFTDKIQTHGAHVIEQDLELASAVAGDELTPVLPELPVDPAAEQWAEKFLPFGDACPSVLINPGAGWGAKRWPIERYGIVVKRLISHGYQVLINAGPGEIPLAEDIAAEADSPVIILHESLARLIAVTRRVTFAIGGDTGPLHLACALGRPVVGIYGPTDPSRNGPYGTGFRVLRSPESRRDHTRHEAPEAGLLTIQPDDVMNAAAELLAEENAR